MTNEELLAAINRRFDENDRRWEQINRRFDENDRRWEENWTQQAEFRRHVDVRFEAVDDRIKQIWEVIGLVDGKLERFRKETKQNFEVVNRRLDVLESHR